MALRSCAYHCAGMVHQYLRDSTSDAQQIHTLTETQTALWCNTDVLQEAVKGGLPYSRGHPHTHATLCQLAPVGKHAEMTLFSPAGGVPAP
jgi:hypothetical protein